MNIGERIKECRKSRGLTQEKLSELLKISPMTVRRWEWGKRKPDIDIMPRLADILNTSVVALMGLQDTAQQSNANCNIASLMDKVSNEDSSIETPISVGQKNDMYIIRDGEREYLIPNDDKGREMFLDFLRDSLKGLGLSEIHSDATLHINNGTNSNYHDSIVNNGTQTTTAN